MNLVPGLGAVPESWGARRGRFALQYQQRPVGKDDGIVTAFRDGEVTLRSNRRTEGFTNAIQEIGYQGVERGDLVVHSMDGFAGAIGVSAARGKMSPVVHVYRCVDGDARFMAYVLRSLASSNYVQALAKGIRERSTSFDRATLADLELPFPASDEQRRIADFLEGQVSRIDQAVRLRQEQIRLVSIRHRTSLVDAAIAMGATAPGVPWFPRSADWLVRPLKAVSRCSDARRIPLSAVERSTRRGEYRYFGASKVVDFVDDYLFEGEYLLVGEDGASLENFDFDVVQRVSGRFWVNNHAHVLFAEKGVTNDYLAHYLRAADRSFLISGATRPKITQEDLMNLPVVVPSPSEQAAMVKVADGMRQAGSTLAESLTRSVDLLQERKQALIAAAVTGEFDVTTASGRGVA